MAKPSSGLCARVDCVLAAMSIDAINTAWPPAVVRTRLWHDAWSEFMLFLGYDVAIRKVIREEVRERHPKPHGT
ncbi:hypothetical protein FQP90_12315 [Paenarthrobacter nitroguajacolicus]|uniref:Uncharacterized protein n=1 Tax=Paenarthrobacter nitroguajacolicus TaxID=211146 RepID=A0A558GZX5_PAENT|nr:hypothetical protein [Paenarthrobacter nitroguajacolicus]TVU62415.1 hypothetical protein FQP90_12315 [Paenarthrobacter nitroguajacolicus]